MAPHKSNKSTRPTPLRTSPKLSLKSLLRNLFHPPRHVHLDQKPQPNQPKGLDLLEDLRREAEAALDLHDAMERWMRGDDPVFGAPSQHWKALHPQMNYHLQRIRHREQHELRGHGRLPACGEKDRATIAFLNGGGDPEETRCWPEGLEEEFLDSLIWQWKGDTGV